MNSKLKFILDLVFVMACQNGVSWRNLPGFCPNALLNFILCKQKIKSSESKGRKTLKINLNFSLLSFSLPFSCPLLQTQTHVKQTHTHAQEYTHTCSCTNTCTLTLYPHTLTHQRQIFTCDNFIHYFGTSVCQNLGH